MSYNHIEQIKARISPSVLISRYLQLKNKGNGEFLGLCPFHQENTPSFTVSDKKGFYHCFGCGAHGTAIGFMMEYQGLDFVESIHELAKSVGMTVPQETRDADRSVAKVTVGLQESLQQAANFYKAELKKSQRAIDYLKNRGLSGQIAAKFQIGYAPAGWQNLQSVFQNHESEALITAGLVVVNEQGRR